MPGDDIREHAVEIIANKFQIGGIGKILAHSLEKPKSSVDRVVFRHLSSVGKTVRQHSAVHVLRKSAQQASRNVISLHGESEARQGNHGIPAPVGEPVITSNDRLLLTSLGDELGG